MLKGRVQRADRTENYSLVTKLAETRKAFQEFAYIVSHDLNAPLRSIINFSQMVEMKYADQLDEKGKHYIELITESGLKAQAQINALLLYSRLHTAPLSIETVECDLLIRDLLKEFQTEIRAKEAHIDVSKLPGIRADAQRFRLLFQCLIGNALRYGGTPPAIEVQARRGNDEWIFSIRDNGIGIDQENHESIFRVFHRLHPDSAYPGVGMGLTLAKKIVEMHGGRIGINSSPGRGAIFFFTLPDSISEISIA